MARNRILRKYTASFRLYYLSLFSGEILEKHAKIKIGQAEWAVKSTLGSCDLRFVYGIGFAN